MGNNFINGIASLLVPFGLYAMPPQGYGRYQRSYLQSTSTTTLLNRHIVSSNTHQTSTVPHQDNSAGESSGDGVDDVFLLSSNPIRELVIIDQAVRNKSAFYQQIKPGVEIREVNSDGNGLVQLKAILSDYQNLDVLHLVTHGSDGVMYIGSSQVTTDLLKQEIDTLATLDKAMRDGADVLLYGCELAKSQKGEDLLEMISGEANVDVAASDDNTGSSQLEADWDLEIHRGEIESGHPFSALALKDFNHILAFTTTHPGHKFCDTGSCTTPVTYGDLSLSATDQVSDYSTTALYIKNGGPDDTFTFTINDTGALYSFQLDSISFQTYGGASSCDITIEGFYASNNASAGSNTFTKTDANNGAATITNVTGKALNKFTVKVCATGSDQNALNHGISTFTLSNHAAPAANPTITNATYDSSNGNLVVTGTNFEAKSGGANDVTVNKLTITGEGGGGSAYTLTGSAVEITSSTEFTVTLTGTDKLRVDALLNKNSTTADDGTTYNLAAADDFIAQTTAGNTAIATSAITVSNYANPSITSVLYESSAGTLAVTGAQFSAISGGTNDVVANTFTLTGDGGDTYTLTDSSNVDVTSATAFTITLSATDKRNVNGILNKDGLSAASGQAYNLAAADNWLAGGASNQNIADAAATINTSNVTAPAISTVAYNQGTGVLTVTGTNFVHKAGGTNDIVVGNLTLDGEAGNSYTLTTGNIEITDATSFAVMLNAADKLVVNGLLNKNGTLSGDNTTYNLNAAEDYMAAVATATNIVDATTGITVSNTQVPAITSATYDANSKALVVTGTGFARKVGGTNDITVAKLSLKGQGSNSYTLTTSDVEITSETAFTVTLSDTDKINVNGLLNKDSTQADDNVTYNLAAAEDWLAGAAASATIADTTGNGVTVSNYADPTVTSATYDYSTGVLAVTGTRFTKHPGVTNDTDLTKIMLKGEASGTRTLTTTNVEITDETTFSVTLNSADKTAVNALLNLNGTQSSDSVTYNLNASDNWMQAADTANNIADATGNGITVSNAPAPSITSATYNFSTGVLTVTGVDFEAKSGAANDVTVNKLTLTGEGGGSYTLTPGTNVEITNATTFSVTLSGIDKTSINALLNKDGAQADSGTTYNLAVADDFMANVTAGNTADTTGNGITVSAQADPVITSATYDFSSGALVVTGTSFSSKSGGTNDVDPTKFTLTGDGGNTYVLTTTSVEITNETTFTATLNATDKTNLNGLLNKDGTTSDTGTTYNLAAADNWMAGAAATTDIADATGNGITVSNVTAPTITSATYDTSTGALVVTGTNFVNEVGSTNDVDPTKFTLTGDSGGTYDLTTAGVEITNATTVTVTLNATDKTNINGLLNKDGTTSDTGTTYNLAAADNWMPGAAATTDIADATSNGITVSNVTQPVITSATYDATTGVLAVTGTNFVNEVGALNDLDLTKITLKGEAVGTHVLTTSNVEITSATSFSVTLSAADKLTVAGLLNKNGTNSDDNTAYNLAAADNWMPGAAATTDIADATNAITVSNVPVPVITSATYDASTGALVVSGTNFTNKSGATNDVVVNKFTLTGDAAATHTLTTTNVEISNATTLTVTLNAADKMAVNGLLNKDGASSGDNTTYNLAAAEDWLAGAAASANIADLTANAITVSNVTAPVITSATYDASTGALVVTGSNFVSESGATNDVDPTKITLTGDASATYVLTTTAVEITNATTFTVTLNTTDITNINGLLNKDGTTSGTGTTYNLAAADNWMAGAAASTDIADATGNGITVSNVTAPTITSATYDTSTRALVVTGTNFVNEVGSTNDVDPSKFTLTGDANATYVLTTSSVEITNATTFTVTLNTTDKTHLNGLLNKDGTTSDTGTTYNLAAADNWMAGAAASTDIADATGNGITVSNVTQPVISSATYDATTGVLAVTGTNFVNEVGALNDLDLTKLTLKGEAAGTYVLTTTNVEITSATVFSVTLSAADKLTVAGLLNKNGTSSDDNTSYNLAAADNWMPGAAATTDIGDATNAITVSNVPVPTITSATYDATTGALVVTGTNFISKSGATNDIDVTKLTLNGEGNNTHTLTSTNVEISDATSFTVTLSAAGKTTVNGLLNKNGLTADGGATYNLAAAEDWLPGAATSANIADLTANAITVSNVTAPVITSAIYNATIGALVVTGSNFVNQSGASNDVDISLLTITGESGASYTITSTTDVEVSSATAFTVTLAGADKTNIDGLLNKNGTVSDSSSTAYNVAAADNWMPGAASSADISDLSNNAITVSNVTVPAITSATYDATTGVLAVTGSNLRNKNGASNDVDVSLFTFTGEGNATYTLTSTSDIEITNASTFSITLSGADKTNIDGLLNKNGSLSNGGTTYNLAAADNWMAGAAASTNIADATSNAITVSNVTVPTITSSTYNFSTATLVITGTNFRNNSGAANDIDVSKLALKGEGSNSYTLTSTNVEISSVTEFTVSLSDTDKINVNGLLNKNGSNAEDNTVYNLAAADNWMPGAAAATDIADTTATVTVSNVTVPTITSVTYDVATGILTITGLNFVKKVGAANDVDISLLTLTGENGATYTIVSATDVEITSSTSFSITLSGADLTSVNNLMTANGTSSGSGTTYNISAADNWMAGTATSTNIADTSNNAITVSNVPTPTVTSATYDANTGSLVVTGTNFVAKTGALNDVAVTKLTLQGEGSGTYTLTSANVEIDSSTQFSVTLNAVDKRNVNGLLNKNGTNADDTNAYNLAAADDFIAGTTAGDSSDATANAITVSNVTVPTITSATYDASSGALVVTGTHLVHKVGSANDIDVSLLTVTGEADGSYTITSTTDIEITDATTFTVTLSGADKTNVDGLLNKNGTSSDTSSTTYNLAVADNWLAGAAASTDIADTTGNGITVSNVSVPTITSATYDATTGALVVTGSNLRNKNGATNDVDISLLTLTGESAATYTITSTTDVEITSATEFTITLSGADKTNIDGLLNKNGSTSDSTTTLYNLAAADNWQPGAAATTDIIDATSGLTVSNVTVPALTSATYDSNSGILVVTGTNFRNKEGATNDVSVSLLTLKGEASGTYTLTSSDVEITNSTSFSVTLNATDKTNINGLLNKNGTSSDDAITYNLAGADNWMAGAAASTDIADATSNGITVSNVTVPTITSMTYDASTGTLLVTGTNFVNKVGATNDIDASLLTLLGEGGTTYTLTDSADVEITSATSFTITLSSTDKLNVDSLLNSNGTSSDDTTTYNLAGADNWMTGASASTDISDTTSNVITVSNVIAPVITSTTYDASTGTLVITGTNFVNKSGASNDVDIAKLTLTGESNGTYVLTSSNVDITSTTSFTVTLNSTDQLNVNGLLNKEGTTSDDATTYNVAAADNWMAGAATSSNIADATNAITVSNVTAPTISSATYNASTGVLVITGTHFVNKSGVSNDVDITKLTLTGEGNGTYVLTSSNVDITSATSFAVTLNSTDQLNVNGLLNKEGTIADDATTYNVAAADNWMTAAAASTDISDTTSNGITVSNVAMPTLTSATYDVSTAVLVVTGSNYVSKSGSTNDVDITKLTFTGEGSSTYTLTSSNVEITSATSFTVTLNSTDQLNINGLLNKNGISSDDATTYNLAGTDNWMAGAAASTDIADSSGNGITVSNVATPTITSATYDASTGGLVITGTNLIKKIGSTNDVDISLLTFTGQGGSTYTLSSASDVEITSSTSFTVTLSSTDLTNTNTLLNKDGLSSTDATTYNLQAADNWMTGAAATVNIVDDTNNIVVSGVNDAPVNTVPSGQTVNEDSSLVFSSGNSNLISIADQEASTVQVTLTVTLGTLSLASTSNLTFSTGTGTTDSTMTFSGTIADVNSALNGLSYAPLGNNNTADSLTILTSDLGATGSGGTLTDTDTIAITITAVNDAPSITSTATTTATEDTLYTYTASVTDVDDANDGTHLTWSLSNAPSGMSVSSTGVVTWTPANGVTTSGAVTLTVSDGGENSATSSTETFTIAVTAVNDAPSITSTAGTTATEDTLYTYIASVTDVDDANDGIHLTWSLSNAPNGMSVSSTGVVTWTPANGVTTSGAVTLTVSDGGENSAASSTETFTIAVTAVNDAPSITSTAGTSATEDVLYTYTASVTDVDDANDGTHLTWSLSNAPSGMSVSSTGVVTWTPANGVTTSEAVTLTVSDGGENSAAASTESFTITVTAANDIPVISSTAITTVNEGGTYSYTFVAIDVDAGDTLTLSAPTIPDWLAFTANTGVLTGTPTHDQVGPHSVVLRVNDGSASVEQSFSLTVVDATPPSLTSSSPVNGETTVSFSDNLVLNFSETVVAGSGAATTIDIRNLADNSLLESIAIANTTISNSIVTINPVANFTPLQSYYVHIGADAIDDGAGNSYVGINNNTSLIFTIKNQAPTSNADTASTNEDESVTVNVLANDGDTDSTLNPASVTIIDAPTNGSTRLDTGSGAITYSPNANFNGTDSFTYTVDDIHNGVTAKSLVTITVEAVNDAPQAISDTASTNEDTLVTIDIASNDTDIDTGDSVDNNTIVITKTPINGNSVIVSGSIEYTPNNNFNGSDTFTYTINDQNSGTSNSATVIVSVTDVNDLPVATDDSITTNEDQSVPISIADNDTDIDGTLDLSSLIITDQSSQGSTSIDGITGLITYTPNADINGADSFTYVIQDNDQGTSNKATVNVTITPVNDAPVTLDDVVTIVEDVAHNINVLGNDSDVDGSLDMTSVTVVSSPAHGTTVVNATTGAIAFTPGANFNGSDSFSYQVKDNLGLSSNVATVTLTIQAQNDNPLANNDSVTTAEDTTVTIDVIANDSDIDGSLEASSIAIVSNTNHGSSVVNNDGTITYEPAENYIGNDSFSYTVLDNESGLSNTATVTIRITSVNDAPVASAQTVQTDEDTELTINLSASDIENDALTYTVLSDPRHGELSGEAPNLIYSPQANFNGTDSFSFKVNDGNVDSSEAIVTINVLPVNDTPELTVIVDQTTQASVPVSLSVIVNDIDSLAAELTVTLTSSNTTLLPNSNMIVNGSGLTKVLNLIPVGRQGGSSTITVTVSDGTSSMTQSFNVTVAAAPVIISDVVLTDSTGQTLNQVQVLPSGGKIEIQASSGSGVFQASVTGPSVDVSGDIIDEGAGRFRFVAPTTGAFAGRYQVTISDVNNGSSERFFIDVPMLLSVEQSNILSGEQIAVSVSGAAAGDQIAFEVIDTAGVVDISGNIATLPTQAVAIDNETTGNPTVVTLNATLVDSFVPFRVNASNLSQTDISMVSSPLLYNVPLIRYCGVVVDDTDIAVSAAVIQVRFFDEGKTVTDDNGRFELLLPRLTNGDYQFSISANNHSLIELSGTDFRMRDNSETCPDNQVVTLNRAGASIRGRLFGLQDGDTAELFAYSSDNNGPTEIGPISITGDDNASNDYSFGLTLGRVYDKIAVRAAGYLSAFSDNSGAGFNLTGDISGVDLSLIRPPVYKVSEELTDASPTITFIETELNIDLSGFSVTALTGTVPLDPIEITTTASRVIAQFEQDLFMTVLLLNSSGEVVFATDYQPLETEREQSESESIADSTIVDVGGGFEVSFGGDSTSNETIRDTITVTLPANGINISAVSSGVLTAILEVERLSTNNNKQASASKGVIVDVNLNIIDGNNQIVDVDESVAGEFLREMIISLPFDTGRVSPGDLQSGLAKIAQASDLASFERGEAATIKPEDILFVDMLNGLVSFRVNHLSVFSVNGNASPEASNSRIEVNVEQTMQGQLFAEDADGDILKYSLVTVPRLGNVQINESNGTFTYTSTSNSNGSDQFSFKVNDGLDDSNTATVSISINGQSIIIRGSGGSGAFGPYLLMILLLFLSLAVGWRFVNIRTGLLCVFMWIMTSTSQAEDHFKPYWYTAGTLGEAHNSKNMEALANKLIAQGYQVDTDTRPISTAFKLLLGRQLTSNFSIETAYLDLGDIDSKTTINGVINQSIIDEMTAEHPVLAEGWIINGQWRWIFDEGFSLLTNVGLFRWHTDVRLHLPDMNNIRISRNGVDIMFGVGSEVPSLINDNTSFLLLIERYKIDKQIVRLLSFGLKYRF